MFCFLATFANTSLCATVISQVDFKLFLNYIDATMHQDIVNILASYVSVTIDGFDLDFTFKDAQDRYVDSTTAKVEHYTNLFSLSSFVKAKGYGGRCRFINNSFAFETS